MLLGRFAATKDSRVLVGPGIGLDAAAIRLGDRVLVAKTDPITFVADEIGTYALLINANDLATMGAKPKWFLATVLLPARSTTASSVTRLFGQLHRICRSLHVSLYGGHSEITDAVTRPVARSRPRHEVPSSLAPGAVHAGDERPTEQSPGRDPLEIPP